MTRLQRRSHVFINLLFLVTQAQQSRQKFLNEHMIKLEREVTEEETGEEELQNADAEALSEICKWQPIRFCLLGGLFPPIRVSFYSYS